MVLSLRKVLTSRLGTSLLKLNSVSLVVVTREYTTVGSSNLISVTKYDITVGL